jgi:N6-L-threonylcarbamoyladenine synthase
MTILAIETSCDDTAAAVVRDGTVLSNIISSQDIHDRYGGIVPELASREHVKGIAPIVRAALAEADVTMNDVDAIAATYGPGLPGSLLVGTQFAKGLAMRHGKPLYPVHHIEAHLYSGYLEDPSLAYPSVCLVVSGGHTSIMHVRSVTDYAVLGSTKDDAAGEAFDKIAKLLGLGYPGGPHVDRLSREGRVDAFDLPRGLMGDGTYDFSFSGLKTAVRRLVEKLRVESTDLPVADICAAAQQAIVDVLVSKTMRAVDDVKARAVVIAGGVSANGHLRTRMAEAAARRGIPFVAPRMGYCVDNAAMIAYVAEMRSAHMASTTRFRIAPRAIRS